MAKMQPVNFKHIDEFLDYLPEQERRLVDFLREIVLDCIPDAREKLSYNVPYYSRNRRICFIWPSSIPWGKVKKEGVMFGSTKEGLIFALEGKTGKVLWKHKIGNSLISTVVPLNGHEVLFTATCGEVGLLRIKN